jgi:hypothetical protein
VVRCHIRGQETGERWASSTARGSAVIEKIRMSQDVPPEPRTKATGVDWVRSLVEQHGPAAQEQISRSLSSTDYEVFRSALPMSWIPLEMALRIYEAAGQILFAREPDALFEIGRGMAKANITTIYKAFIRIATIPYVMSQVARLWRTYHDTGEASAERGSVAKEVFFVVRDYPGLSAQMRKLLRGYVTGVTELVGLRNVAVELDESDPSAWKWRITWK